jgi:hypothetical protein
MTRQRLRGFWTAGVRSLQFLTTGVAAAAILALIGSASLLAQDAADTMPHLDIYGFAMLDTGYETGRADPNWYDVLRPTKLPSTPTEFGADGHYFAGVRQTRFGVKSFVPTTAGPLKVTFEFELFGTGVDAGQTTFRLRHAYGELGKFGAGQTWSPFMDIDVFPNSVEYWGPNGMVFYRNVQARYTPWSNGDSRLVFAIERPGGGGDQGIYGIQLAGVSGRFPAPDISGHFRKAGAKGHIQIAGIYRRLNWDDANATSAQDLTGSANGWGINVSSNIKLKRNVVRLQYVYGEGIQNYMNDATSDVGVEASPSTPTQLIVGKPLPMDGIVAFIDLNWSEKFTSSVGYSRLDVNNTDGQGGTAFKSGQYALGNILYYPTKGVMLGPEIQWGQREGKNGFTESDWKFQFSAKYNFNFRVGG